MAPDRPGVCAVVVGSLGSPYLPRTLAALAGQHHAPERVLLAVLPDGEAGPGLPTSDGEGEGEYAPSPEAAGVLLNEAGLGADRADDVAPGGVQVVHLRDSHGFSDAVDTALGHTEGDVGAWLWLLHDDSAPDPAALAELLGAVDRSEQVVVAGMKQVEWDQPDRLISVGVDMTVDGQRFTGVEAGEIDQGQHDGREDVYAVGTAGMLIRTRLWRDLGGADHTLGSFADGADISRRARLTGRRVIVVPTARVQHARAGYHGLRTRSGARTTEPAAPDARRSFASRRAAQLHSWLVRSPLALVPLAALAVLLLAPLRAVSQVAAKELSLATVELRAALTAVLRPHAVARARRQARATRKVPARRLVPLQATWAQLWRARRNRRLQLAAEQRAARAPSELEMAERAAVARRRRIAFTVVLVLTGGAAALTLGPVVAAGPLIGGALLPVDATFGQLWQVALSAWIPAGDGHAGPPDPFLFLLGLISALTGGGFGMPVQVSIALVLVLAMPLAAIGAWFAAGAASRSVLVRAWAAGVWAFGPPLLLSLGDGRLGAVLAHLALPLVALGLARALGVDRRDVVVSGMVGAQRLRRTAAPAPRRSARQAKRARLAALAAVGQERDTDNVFADLEPIPSNTAPGTAAAGSDATGAVVPGTAGSGQDAGTDAAARPDGSGGAGEAGAGEQAGAADADEAAGGRAGETRADQDADAETVSEQATVISRMSRAPSMAAAAAAGLALAAAVAGAPVLLPASVLILTVIALALGRRRHLHAGRARLIVVALPAVVLMAPIWSGAISTWGEGGWRVLLADPGVPAGAETPAAWLTLLGWPALPPDGAGDAAGVAGVLSDQVLPLAATGALVIGALLALVRGGGRGRAVRIGWLISAIGLAAALLSGRTEVAVGRGPDGVDELVTGWAGPGTSLVLLGFLVATVIGLDGLQGSLAGRSFGWRQVSAAVVTAALVAGLLTSAVSWTAGVMGDNGDDDLGAASDDDQVIALTGRGADPVPALGRALAEDGQGARVLALTATPEAVDAQLWRGNGPQLTETSTVVGVRQVLGHLESAESAEGTQRAEGAQDAEAAGAAPAAQAADEAGAQLMSLVADLTTGTAADAGPRLATHAVGVVIVPPAETTATGVPVTDEAARTRLIAQLDAILGLERVTENPSGVIWRVSAAPGSTDAAIARAQVRDDEGRIANVPMTHDSGQVTLAPEGADRTLVLAERSATAWRAEIDGRSLRAASDDWRQGFIVPGGAAGELTVQYRPNLHTPWQVVTLVVIGLTVLLALPTRRRRGEGIG